MTDTRMNETQGERSHNRPMSVTELLQPGALLLDLQKLLKRAESGGELKGEELLRIARAGAAGRDLNGENISAQNISQLRKDLALRNIDHLINELSVRYHIQELEAEFEHRNINAKVRKHSTGHIATLGMRNAGKSVFFTNLANKVFGAEEPHNLWSKMGVEKLEEYSRTGKTDLDSKSLKVYYSSMLYEINRLIGINLSNGTAGKLGGMKVLEAGCGTGLLTIEMAAHGARGCLMDEDQPWHKYSKILGEKARERPGFAGDLTYVNSNMFDPEFLRQNERAFDVVHNEGVIEHYTPQNAVGMVEHMSLLAKRGGHVIVGVPNFLSPNMFALWLKNGKLDEIYYDERMLRYVLEGAGLRNVKVVTSELAFPHWLSPRLAKPLSRLEKFVGRELRFGFLHLGVGEVE